MATALIAEGHEEVEAAPAEGMLDVVRTLSRDVSRTVSGLATQLDLPATDDDADDEAVAARRAEKLATQRARGGWRRIKGALRTSAAFAEAADRRDVSRRIAKTLNHAPFFAPDDDVALPLLSRAKIVAFEVCDGTIMGMLDVVKSTPAFVMMTRYLVAVSGTVRAGATMPSAWQMLWGGGCVGGSFTPASFIGSLYTGLATGLALEIVVRPLYSPESWRFAIERLRYLYTGNLECGWERSVCQSRTWMLGARLAMALPALSHRTAMVRNICGDVVSPGDLMTAAIGERWPSGPNNRLAHGLCGFHWNTIICFLAGDVEIKRYGKLPWLKHCEPALYLTTNHPSSDGRSYWQLYRRYWFAERAASALAYTGILAALRQTNISPNPLSMKWSLAEASCLGLVWSGLTIFRGSLILSAPTWGEGLVGTAKYNVVSLACNMIGTAVAYPFSRVYVRHIRPRFRDALLADDEKHMRKRLRHAHENAAVLRATVLTDSSKLGEDDGDGVKTKPLAVKRDMLHSRIKGLFISTQSPLRNTSGQRSKERVLRLEVERLSDVGDFLETFATVDRTAIMNGVVEVNFKGEMGADWGGVSRDFFSNYLSPYIADLSHGLFALAPDGGLLPKRGAASHGGDVRLFAIGRLIALAVTSDHPLSIRLSRGFYKVLIQEQITVQDVYRIDEFFAKNFIEPLLTPGGVAVLEGYLDEPLTFVSLEGREERGEVAHAQTDLIEGGSKAQVTEDNKYEYLELLIEHYLVGYCRDDLACLVEGFYDIIPPRVLQHPNPEHRLTAAELEVVTTGKPDIDVNEWRHCAVGSLVDSKRFNLWFWAAVEAMSPEERALLLSFATGSSRLPADGFEGLERQFRVDLTKEPREHVPTAHTCFNQLCIPESYRSAEELQEKLLVAITEGGGFGFV